ncbi:MAG: theronine dehydrogenase-like Zn-dependent dehydrogenase [Firmicutes bacterium]|nr:theronine dehydrogenase-like Zn-dependent dehydrogenase [Bacillota bacterium]
MIGVGPVGQSTCLLAKKVFGAKKVIAIDILPNRIDLALKAGVADVGINPATDDIAAIIKEATGGMGVDCTIEGAGVAQTMAMAAGITRVGGIVSTISIFNEQYVGIPMNEMLIKGQKLHFGIQTQEGVPEMMKMIQDGKIDARFITTHRAPLNDIMKGFEVFGNRQDGCVKWLVTPYER